MTRTITAALTAVLLITTLTTAANAAPRKGTFGSHAAYKGIRIHMTLKHATATGTLKRPVSSGPCLHTNYKRKPSLIGVWISRRVGVAIIGAPRSARTPRGIGVGSTRTQVRKAYPKLRHSINADTVRVPGYQRVLYGFQFDKNKVTTMWLMSARQNCVN